MTLLLLLPLFLQALAMFFDEFVFHRARGLPRWERLGHPLDTLTVAVCYGWLVSTPPTRAHAVAVYVVLCAFSCLFITKDEFVHARLCKPAEAWLHAVLFVLHPAVFLALGIIWMRGGNEWIPKAVLGATLAMMMYQLIYWSPRWHWGDK
ncbi:MAG: hypothetical protein SFV15_12145 [Polyangiaceae bacterium]|nr:hypothetical protein [Polyangiaceae bacterium]